MLPPFWCFLGACKPGKPRPPDVDGTLLMPCVWLSELPHLSRLYACEILLRQIMAEHPVPLKCGLEWRDKYLVRQCLRLMVGGILGLRHLQVPSSIWIVEYRFIKSPSAWDSIIYSLLQNIIQDLLVATSSSCCALTFFDNSIVRLLGLHNLYWLISQIIRDLVLPFFIFISPSPQ